MKMVIHHLKNNNCMDYSSILGENNNNCMDYSSISGEEFHKTTFQENLDRIVMLGVRNMARKLHWILKLEKDLELPESYRPIPLWIGSVLARRLWR